MKVSMPNELSPDGQGEGKDNAISRLSQDRGDWLTWGLLIVLAALAWIAVFRESTKMSGSSMVEPEMGMLVEVGSGHEMPFEAPTFLLSWGMMMAAMMLPSATPMIALYGTLRRTFSRTGHTGIPTTLFTLVYLTVWLAFGVPVYAASVIVSSAAAMHPVAAVLLPYAVTVVLLGSGVYQFSRLKKVCLHVCQNPLMFLMKRWQSGYPGTLRMALEHAAYCVGCCWALMVVLVAAGAMALHWVLLIAALVFAEKLFPHGEWTARIIGVVLILLGVLVAIQPGLAAVLRSQTM